MPLNQVGHRKLRRKEHAATVYLRKQFMINADTSCGLLLAPISAAVAPPQISAAVEATAGRQQCGEAERSPSWVMHLQR
jgi:hypothetical protein